MLLCKWMLQKSEMQHALTGQFVKTQQLTCLLNRDICSTQPEKTKNCLDFVVFMKEIEGTAFDDPAILLVQTIKYSM